MRPLAVPAELPLNWRRWLCRIARQPVANDVIIKLFAPEQSGVALARNLLRFFIDSGWRNRVVEFIRLFDSLTKVFIEICKRITGYCILRRETKPDDLRLPRFNRQDVVRRELCPSLPRIHRIG